MKKRRVLATILAALLAIGSVELSAPTAYAAQAELVPEKTEQLETSNVMTITDFEELEEAVMQQLLPVGASEEEIIFPATLNVTVFAAEEQGTNDGEAAARTKNVALTGVTWEIDPAESDGEGFDSCEDCDGYCYVYTPVLPKTDEDGNTLTLGEGVEAPAIYVLIGEGKDHVSAIAESDYTGEGFCEGYKWENGSLVLKDENTSCTNHENCNGYQPATLKSYDVDGDSTIAEGEQAYEITNAGQLYWFAAYVNEGGENLNANAYLANDITVNENLLSRITTDETTGEITNDSTFRKWGPIGNYAKDKSLKYAGVFDGKNHSIKGIYINEITKQRMGIFGWQSGTIENLSVEDSRIIAKSFVGGIIGVNGGKVKNCRFKGEVTSTSTEENHSSVGGICGANVKGSVIIKCVNEGKVEGYISRVGGIAGYTVNEIKESVNEGEVIIHYSKISGTERGYTGGIVGLNLASGTSKGKIINCLNAGNIKGYKAQGTGAVMPYVGGISGANDGAEISSCFNNGEIDGDCNKAGIAGLNLKKNDAGNSGIITNSGDTGSKANERSLVCENDSECEIKNCYIIGNNAGKFDNGKCENIFYLSENGETDSYESTTAMTTADFASGKVTYLLNQGQENNEIVWYQNIDSGTKDSYPVLDSTHGTVYASQPCAIRFSNDSTTAGTEEHSITQLEGDTTKHTCTKCNEKMEHSPAFTGTKNTITGKCSECQAELGSFTLNAPTSLTYDGTAKEASVSGTITGVTDTPTISYFKVVNETETPLDGQKPTNAGTYKASISCGEDAGTQTVSVIFTITKATLTDGVTAEDISVTYDGSALDSSDIQSSTNVNGTWSWKDGKAPKNVADSTSNGKTWTVVFTPANENYEPVEQTVNVTIQPKNVTISGLSVEDREYDGTTTATVTGTAVVDGKIGDDDVSVQNGTAAFEDKNAGTGKNVNFSDYSLTGTAAGNYNLTAQPTATGTINQKNVTISGVTATDRDYDGSTAVDLTGGELSGVLESDKANVGFALGTGTMSNANAGVNKSVTTNITLTGTATGNYTLTQPTGITVTINKIDPSYTVPTGLTATYGQTLADVSLSGHSGWSWKDATSTLVGDVGDRSFDAVFTPTDTTNYNAVTESVTIAVGKATYNGGNPVTAAGSAKYGASGTVDLSNLIMPGGTAAASVKTDGSSVLDTYSIENDTSLQFTFKGDAALVDKTAEIEVSVTGCTNYKDYKITVTVTVNAKTVPTVTAPTAKILTYNGSDQTLITAGSTNGGTLQYSLDNSTWSAALPKAKGANTYTVYYKVNGNADYADTAVNSIPVTIGKKAITVKPKSYTITKGNAIPAFALEYDGLVSGDSLTTSAAPTFTCYEADGKTAVSTATAAGSYTITWTNSDAFDFTSETNYTVTKETTGTLTINNKSSGGGSGSSSSTTSSTVKNPDGSTTTTVTDKKTGTVTETTTTPNGTTSTTVTDKNGNSTTTVSVSKKDAQSGETITLPVDEVKAAASSENATEITVNVPSGGATVEIPVKNPTPGTVIVIVDKDGNETVVPTTKQTENGVSVTLTEDATIKVIENSKDFSDVKSSDYFDKAVDWASSRGITGGNSATTFGPHDSCTRAQLVTFLWRAAGQPEAKGESGMSDVATNTYYTDAVAWAFENEIVGGYGNGQFGSEDTITREQMATILYRFAQKTGMDTTQGGMAVREYKDYDSISDYALTAIQWAVNAGVMQGYDGNLMPGQPCTRAQIVTMLYRLLGQ